MNEPSNRVWFQITMLRHLAKKEVDLWIDSRSRDMTYDAIRVPLELTIRRGLSEVLSPIVKYQIEYKTTKKQLEVVWDKL